MIVFREPGFCGIGIRKILEVIGIANRLAGVDVDPDCFHEVSRLIRQHAEVKA